MKQVLVVLSVGFLCSVLVYPNISFARSNAIPITTPENIKELPCFLMDVTAREVFGLRQMGATKQSVIAHFERLVEYKPYEQQKQMEYIVNTLTYYAYKEPIFENLEERQRQRDVFVEKASVGCRVK